jgi:hypothetical protein
MDFYKLKVDDYFNNLMNSLDIYTENKLKLCIEDEAESNVLNQDREKIIGKISEIRDFNLKTIDFLDLANEKLVISDARLFQKFCFLFINKKSYPVKLHLVVTDIFLSENEINAWIDLQFNYRFNSILENNPFFKLSVICYIFLNFIF